MALFGSSVGTAEDYSVGTQYESTHVYVAPADLDAFTASFKATFGGTRTPAGVFQVTPTPSQTVSQIVITPAGLVSTFGFKTPIPYPFGLDRYGYLVTDVDRAARAARTAGADIIVAPFDDPIGRDAIVQWPGGVTMQLYWHKVPPHYPALATLPEGRIYVSAGRADSFVRDFTLFSKGHVTADIKDAPGVEVGLGDQTYRRIDVKSGFGKLRVMVSDGHLPWPYGREVTGYEVTDLGATIQKATATGAKVLVAPFVSGNRKSAMLQFPGGYIAEIHATTRPGATR
jgi:predicted enzyme related to lactoylglutathione lyase